MKIILIFTQRHLLRQPGVLVQPVPAKGNFPETQQGQSRPGNSQELLKLHLDGSASMMQSHILSTFRMHDCAFECNCCAVDHGDNVMDGLHCNHFVTEFLFHVIEGFVQGLNERIVLCLHKLKY